MSKANDKKKKKAAAGARKGTPSAYKTAQSGPPVTPVSFGKKGSKSK